MANAMHIEEVKASMYHLNTMKSWLDNLGWKFVILLGSVAGLYFLIGMLVIKTGAKPVTVWLVSFVLVVFAWLGWSTYNEVRRAQRRPARLDFTAARREKRVRRATSFNRQAPFVAGALLIAAAALPVIGLMPFISIGLALAAASVMIGWWANTGWLKREQIPDRATREAAHADLSWRRANQLPWWIAGLFGVQLSLWTLTSYFGVFIPFGYWLSLLSFPLFTLYLTFGSMLLGIGIAGRSVPAEPFCFKCAEPYDMVNKPVQCPKCRVGLSDSLLIQTRWVRSPKLISFGAVCLIVGITDLLIVFSPASTRAVTSVLPTRGLIARLNISDSIIEEKSLWAELQSRMPMAVTDRDCLVDVLLYRASSEYGSLFLLASSDMETWLKKELTNGPHAEEHLDRALEIVEKTSLLNDDVFNINELAGALYAAPPSKLTPKQFDRLVRFTFQALESEASNGWLVWIGGSKWLTEQSKAGRLSPEQEERLRVDADALDGL